MNENEIERIAHAANALRPDWPIGSIRTLLSKPELAHRPRRDVAVALTWVACESKSKTPARVLEAGPWWQAVADPSEGGAPRIDDRTRCYHCNYPEPSCRRLRELDPLDPHEFVARGDVLDGRVRMENEAAPMPAAVREALRGREIETEESK